MTTWQAFLAGCGAVITIGGAVGVIVKWFSPAISFVGRLETLENYRKSDYERILRNEETNRVLCEGMICLLEVAEEQTKENPTNLGRIQNAKQNIQQYLITGVTSCVRKN